MITKWSALGVGVPASVSDPDPEGATGSEQPQKKEQLRSPARRQREENATSHIQFRRCFQLFVLYYLLCVQPTSTWIVERVGAAAYVLTWFFEGGKRE